MNMQVPAASAAGGSAFPPVPGRSLFGTLPDGRVVEAVTIADARGMTARLITLGAGLQGLWVPDRAGRMGDVVLGHDDLAGYVERRSFLGGIVGRCANRIAGGRFRLDGRAFQVPCNDGPNSLHGGNQGLDMRLWTLEAVTPGSATFRYDSPDGEEGYPGALSIRAVYALDGQGALSLTLTAQTDAPTIVNLSSHAYFNLGGAVAGGDVLDHVLTLAADRFTPVDATLIPTGALSSVAGTVFDFRTPHRIGDRIRDAGDAQLRLGRGYDHNFALRAGGGPNPEPAARLEHPATGRVMELATTEPGLQFYSGNALAGDLAGKGGRLYRQSAGLCLEPQRFPDAINQPDFPSPRLDPGQTYRHVSVYRFSTLAGAGG
ncbi:aldose epimerase family protein [Niveispirillum fermenti]|uniref:aldose epimerase family protein n=2 Tax=Niveispirillum fermenti TaxID=1233113 RepID=UPI003A89AFA4